MELCRNLKKSKSQTIIIIPPQARIVQLAENVMVIADGRVSQFGPREEILPGLQADMDMEEECSCVAGWQPAKV